MTDTTDTATENPGAEATTPGTEIVEAPTARRQAVRAYAMATIAEQSGWNKDLVESGHILIFPSYVRQISALHQVKLEMVQVAMPLSGQKGSDDLYHFKGADYCARKGLLERMTHMAGIRWDTPKFTYPEPGILSCTVRGGVYGPDGTMSYKVGSKEWIEDVELVAIEGRADAQVAKGELAESYRDRWVREQMAEAKRERQSKTETKAKNRVRREILGLPGAAPLSYWEKPFFIPRIDVLIDPDDPETRRQVREDYFQSSKLLGFTPDAAIDVEIVED